MTSSRFPRRLALNFEAGRSAAPPLRSTIKGDTLLEGFETVLVTLSGGSVVAGRNVATLRLPMMIS